jgi:hypothetical protein
MRHGKNGPPKIARGQAETIGHVRIDGSFSQVRKCAGRQARSRIGVEDFDFVYVAVAFFARSDEGT